ncbi:hypothetical protein MKW92_048208 [Papaver armeniacum]|nr:hypothetical protein MKW92_048208 [Papaver armeniacum]
MLADCGLSYAVVPIMGPQSSGMNFLKSIKSQTTKGIWMNKCTLIMDLEGTDGRKRRGMPEIHDCTAFQCALFALTVSDNVLICKLSSFTVTQWDHDNDREQAANKALLKTVFQTSLENLEHVVWEDIQKLISYEEKEEQFKEQTRFYHSIAPGGLSGD